MTDPSISPPRHSDEWCDLAAAFIERRIDVDSNGCWIPRLKVDRHGYVRTTFRYRHVFLHRLAWEAHRGPIPDGLVIDHLCRVTACCNPAHLEPVTNWENTLRSTNPLAQRAQQTHCKRGHEFTPENTRRRSTTRECWTCHYELRADPTTKGAR